jgi:hypothetical protein
MKIGRVFSFLILFAVALSSVGFTSLAWYCPMEKQDMAMCGGCAEEQSQKPSCEDDDCCEQHAELMKVQADVSAAVKLQPNLDSPEMQGLVESPETLQPLTKRWAHSPVFARALPDRVAHEHVVLRI